MEHAITECDKLCDINEQMACYEKWNRDKKRSEKQEFLCKVPWYKREKPKNLSQGVCETCG